MSSIENLTNKILSDSEAKAKEILDAAKAEAQKAADAAAADAEERKARILAEAKAEAARKEDQIVVGKTLMVRDQALNAKQQMLDKVFQEAVRQLGEMSREDYMKFLVESLSALDLDGEELVLPAKYGVTSIDEINDALKKAGKKGNLTLSKRDDGIQGGFILAKGGIEQNNTFEALISHYRYELEDEVLKKLY